MNRVYFFGSQDSDVQHQYDSSSESFLTSVVGSCLLQLCRQHVAEQVRFDPDRYDDIAVNHKDLAAQLGTFFKGLYSQSLLDLAALRAKIGDIDDHYQTFVTTNKVGKCPFCGIGDIKGVHHSKREAYDHYLPKALYPFNSINFRNLAPACHKCNSTYKLSKDPAHNLAGRRKAFYPFAAAAQIIDIQVALQHSDIENLKPTDVQMQFGPAITEEIETWKEVYGIEERYKAKLCGENDGKYWLTQVLDECQAVDKQPTDVLAMRAQQAQSRPYADCNFLRRPFLEACQQIGVFSKPHSSPRQCSYAREASRHMVNRPPP